LVKNLKERLVGAARPRLLQGTQTSATFVTPTSDFLGLMPTSSSGSLSALTELWIRRSRFELGFEFGELFLQLLDILLGSVHVVFSHGRCVPRRAPGRHAA